MGLGLSFIHIGDIKIILEFDEILCINSCFNRTKIKLFDYTLTSLTFFLFLIFLMVILFGIKLDFNFLVDFSEL